MSRKAAQHPKFLATRSRRARALRRRRAVSEVIGTILILALTVVLFSTIFFFVNTYPKPASQPVSQFQGQLYFSYQSKGTHSWENVSYLAITHLSGPAVDALGTIFYVVSQAHPQNTTVTYTLSSGGIGTANSGTWNTGQVWNLSLAGDHLTYPDNITVTVVTSGSVIYRQTLPGTNPTIPPIFENVGASPGNPVVGSPFSVFVQVSDPFLRTTSSQVYLNITTPGMTCGTPLGTYPATTGEYRFAYNTTNGLWFVPGCTVSAVGVYYVTAWVTDSNPIQTLQNSIIFPIAVGLSTTGPTCSNTYSAAAGYSPSTVGSDTAVTLYLNITNINICAWIYVSGSWSASTGTQNSATTFTNDFVAAGGTTVQTESWTSPTVHFHGGGTATITFTLSSPSDATGPTTVTLSIPY
jgi:flagellin-like protein